MLQESGQVTIEYFLLFAVLIVITALGLSTFDNGVRTTMEEVVQQATKTMSTPTGGTPISPNCTDPDGPC